MGSGSAIGDWIVKEAAPALITGSTELGWPAGKGGMVECVRNHEWVATPLGPPETWPTSLRVVVGLMLGSRQPMFVAWGPELCFLYNDGYQPMLGTKHPHAFGQPIRQVWAEIWPDIAPLIDRALAGEATWSENMHLVMERYGYPEDTWYTFSYSPVRDEAGAIAGMFCACTETTGQVLADRLRATAEAALRESEERWHAIFRNMHEGFALCEIVYGPGGEAVDFRYLEVNAAWERLTGVPPTATVGRLASEAIPGIEPFWTATYAQVVETGKPTHFEYHLASLGRWFEVFAYRTEPGRFAALFLNITERKAAEERQRLMSREVDHRAKNALTVVQAALRLTTAPDVAGYRRIIEGRVGALARAQSMLAQDRWTGADLCALLAGELAPFLVGGDEPEPRASLTGPPVVLPAGVTQPLAMAVHELATNALKHGALSAPAGHIAVSWNVEQRPDGVTLLRLRWAEAGGPSVDSAPERRGFGSRVLDGTIRGQLGGNVSRIWALGGMICDLEVPLRPMGRPR